MTLLTALAIRDFRNVERLELDVPPAGAALVGDNGQGKTNLLEAVYYFHTLRSLRGARDVDLVRFDAPAFHLRARFAHGRRDGAPDSALDSAPDRGAPDATHEATAAFERAGGRKRVTVDGAEPRRLSSALGTVASVVIAPRDVELVAGAPGERRRFLDVVLALTSPRYLAALQGYRAALARRNAALRAAARQGGRAPEDAVAVWEPALAETGAVLIAERAAWIAGSAASFAACTMALGERAAMGLRYVTGVPDPGDARDALRGALERRRAHDVRRGATHPGPHRDDLALTIAGRELRVFGSAGQQRTAAIALRLLERATLRASRGDDPLLLLDDPFAELDPGRSRRMLDLLPQEGQGQTFLAVPRASDIPAGFTRLPRWEVRAGDVAFTAGTGV